MTVAELIGELLKLPQERNVYFDTGSYQLEPVDVAGTYDRRGIVLLDTDAMSVLSTIEKDDEELERRCLVDGRHDAK